MFEVPAEKINGLLSRTDRSVDWKLLLDRITPGNPCDLETASILIRAAGESSDAFSAIIEKANSIKQQVFGNAVKLFVPVYISNSCINNCEYCAYRRDNTEMPRRTLTGDEFRREIEQVVGMGYRVIELVTGESPDLKPPGSLAKYVRIAREVVDSAAQSDDPPEIILMSWALDDAEFVSVREGGPDSFYLWQETYDRKTFESVHSSDSPKADFDWRTGVFDRAIKAGIRRVGIGVLFGLGRLDFDMLALISHGMYLQETYGITIDALGLPRFKPAQGTPMQVAPSPVSDDELKLAVALYRLAFPHSHLFLNTREKLNLLLELLDGGGSEMNIACAVYPGGYTEPKSERQFEHYSYPTDKTVKLIEERGHKLSHFVSHATIHS